jgi:hypothetical protein
VLGGEPNSGMLMCCWCVPTGEAAHSTALAPVLSAVQRTMACCGTKQLRRCGHVHGKRCSDGGIVSPLTWPATAGTRSLTCVGAGSRANLRHRHPVGTESISCV